jgi:membrane protease subunit HflK
MAWNEPGDSGKKDPWGGGGNKQGPPDLDEVVKNLQKKFGSIFGGGTGGGQGSSSGGSGKLGSIGVILILFVAIAVWAASGIYIIDEGTRGVIRTFGEYSATSLPGPHWYPRFVQNVAVVDVEKIRDATIGYRAGTGNRQAISSVSRESLMLTHDENIVDIHMAVQYKVKSASDFVFNVKDPEITLRQATESAVREIIGKSNMDFVLTKGRAEISSQTKTLIQKILDKYGTGLEITSVNMQYAQPPEQVKPAFDDAVKAREDNERLKNEAQAYANDILPRASGKAARLIQEARAYKDKVIAEATGEVSRFLKVLAEYKKAPVVTRKRLYIEAVESVLSNTSKILVDLKGGNNLLYLPLDRMVGRQDDRVMPMPGLEDSESVQSGVNSQSRGSSRSRGER